MKPNKHNLKRVGARVLRGLALLAVCATALLAKTKRAIVWHHAPCKITNTGDTLSMGEVFPPGATANLEPASPDADLVGLVPAMKDVLHEREVVHRCIAQGRAANGRMYYVTKGDANMWPDPIRWSYEDLLGVLDLPRKL